MKGLFSRKGNLYVFVGPVASGKSTLRKFITAYLTCKGMLVLTLMHKTFLPRFIELLRKIVGEKATVNAYLNLYKLFLLVDLIIWIILVFWLYICSKIFQIIIIEDYLVGALHDYIYITRFFLKKRTKIARLSIIIPLLLLWICKPKYIVYIYVDEMESRRRQLLRGDKQLEHELYLKSQYMLLYRIAKILCQSLGIELIMIDTTALNPVRSSSSLILALGLKHQRFR